MTSNLKTNYSEEELVELNTQSRIKANLLRDMLSTTTRMNDTTPPRINGNSQCLKFLKGQQR